MPLYDLHAERARSALRVRDGCTTFVPRHASITILVDGPLGLPTLWCGAMAPA